MKITNDVHGTTCMHCHDRVTKVIPSLEDVKTVERSLEDNNATVSFDPEKITIDGIWQVVTGAVYEVVKV